MKTFKITINPKVGEIEIAVKNGRKFTDAIISGYYSVFNVNMNEADTIKMKKFAVKFADDKNSNGGSWYAHCNGYNMDMIINYRGEMSINTYGHYRRHYK